LGSGGKLALPILEDVVYLVVRGTEGTEGILGIVGTAYSGLENSICIL
jgi:hypothetical protein